MQPAKRVKHVALGSPTVVKGDSEDGRRRKQKDEEKEEGELVGQLWVYVCVFLPSSSIPPSQLAFPFIGASLQARSAAVDWPLVPGAVPRVAEARCKWQQVEREPAAPSRWDPRNTRPGSGSGSAHSASRLAGGAAGGACGGGSCCCCSRLPREAGYKYLPRRGRP